MHELKKYFGLLFVCIALLSLIPDIAFAQDSHQGNSNVDLYGILTLLPPLVAITLAFITKNVILSLFLGVFSGTFMLQLQNNGLLLGLGTGFLHTTNEAIVALADPWNAGIVLQVLMIGALIALITHLGGVKAVAEWMSKFAKTARSSQIVTWFMGLFIFFDDYANSLIVGPMMRPVMDKMRVSREKFAFIVDATAAPIAGMALISTWVAYELGVIKSAVDSIGQSYDAYGIFVASLPYRFYNILILAFIVISALLLRDFGSMYKAEKRARLTGEVVRAGSVPMQTDTMTPLNVVDVKTSSVWFAIIPICTLIFGAFFGFYFNGQSNVLAGDDLGAIAVVQSGFSFEKVRIAFSNADASVMLFQAAFLATVVAIIMGLICKRFKLREALETTLTGLKSMNITVVILIFAWSLSSVIKQLGTAEYLVHHLSGAVPMWSLPAIIFILGSIISFATGTSYGTMGILMPLAIPLGWAILPTYDYLVLCSGAVLTGAIFGDHCSPISDTSILTAMGTACDLMDHIKTQMLYSLCVAFMSVGLFILAALQVNIWLLLLLGFAVLFLLIRFVGKRVPDAPAV